MGTSKRDRNAKRSSTPGPNAYSPRLTPRSQGFSFGTMKRSSSSRSANSPGPGMHAVYVTVCVCAVEQFPFLAIFAAVAHVFASIPVCAHGLWWLA